MVIRCWNDVIFKLVLLLVAVLCFVPAVLMMLASLPLFVLLWWGELIAIPQIIWGLPVKFYRILFGMIFNLNPER